MIGRENMRSLRSIALAVLASGIVVLTLPVGAAADEGVPVSFYELIQQGEGVVLRFDYDTWSPDPVDTYPVTLSRDDVDRTVVLIDNEPLPAAAVYEIGDVWCWDGEDEEYCQTVDWCTDCDGDDVPECLGPCAYTQYYEFVDECVMPGAVEYHITGEDSYWPDAAWLTMEDVGQDCPVPAENGGGGGCSVSGAGDRLPGGALALIMLGIGLVACRLGRSEKLR
jgi:hypothetical protein